MKRFNPAALVAEETSPKAAECRRQKEEQIARREKLFIEHYGQPGAEKVAVPHGMMAVTLSLCYDNSDSMTDYFDRHANLSPEFVLLVVNKQAETERLARRALAIVFPDIGPDAVSGKEWKWHTEKWSMGHGNYLDSPGFELLDALKNLETQYRGGGVTHGHWEIEFRRPYQDGGELHLWPHRNFGKNTANPAPNPTPLDGCDAVTTTLIESKHTKTLATIFVVQLANRVDRKEYERINEMARSLGGYYSSFRRDGALPGFIFKEKVQAETLMSKLAPIQLPRPEPEPASPPPISHVPQIVPMTGLQPCQPVRPTWQQRFRRP